MKKALGKRKQLEPPLLNYLQWNFIDISTLDVHAIDVDFIVNGIIEEIRSGVHSSVHDRETSLQMQRRKIIDAADRHRKLQFFNINNLYEYEVEDANAQYERARCEMEDKLIEELLVEKERLINLQQAHSPKDRRIRNNSEELLETAHTAPPRTLRSSIPLESKSDNHLNSDGIRTNSRGVNKKPDDYFDKSLSNAEIKSDLIEILSEVKAHGEQLRSTQPQQIQSVILSEDMTTLLVNGVDYHIGQEISVLSVLSQEVLSGMLISMDPIRALVRAPNGLRFSFQYALLKAGRVVICS